VKKLVPLFFLLPVVEILLLLEFGYRVGVAWTLLTIFVTAFLGLRLIRRQGVQTLIKVQRDLTAGILPANSIVDGLLFAVAGALLTVPGLLTDLAGCFILIQDVRTNIKLYLAKSLERFVRHRATRININFRNEGEKFQPDSAPIKRVAPE
jgi:UPF0716 protein FxsA